MPIKNRKPEEFDWTTVVKPVAWLVGLAVGAGLWVVRCWKGKP